MSFLNSNSQNSQNFTQDPHPVLNTLLPTAINAGMGLAMGVNPLAVGLKSLSNGYGSYRMADAYKRRYDAFDGQRTSFSRLLPDQLKPMAQSATSYDQLNNIAKTYYPMVQGQNSIQDYNNQYQSVLNSPLNPYSDPTQAGKITSDLAGLTKDLKRQGTTDDFMNGRTMKLPRLYRPNTPTPNNGIQNVNNFQPNSYDPQSTNNLPLVPLDNPILNNKTLTLEQKRNILYPNVVRNDGARETTINGAPFDGNSLSAGVEQNTIENGSLNPFVIMAKGNMYNDAFKQGASYNPLLNPSANLSNVMASQAPIRTGIMQRNSNINAGRLGLARDEFGYRKTHSGINTKNQDYANDLSEYYQILQSGDSNKINYARNTFMRKHAADPNKDIQQKQGGLL